MRKYETLRQEAQLAHLNRTPFTVDPELVLTLLEDFAELAEELKETEEDLEWHQQEIARYEEEE